MVQVQFDEGPEITQNARSLERRSFSLAAWLVRAGIVKNERQGDILLIGIFILCILLSIYFFTKTFRTPAAFSDNPAVAPAPAASPR